MMFEVPWRDGPIDGATMAADWYALLGAGVSPCFLNIATVCLEF
jgi:hypothetical protein